MSLPGVPGALASLGMPGAAAAAAAAAAAGRLGLGTLGAGGNSVLLVSNLNHEVSLTEPLVATPNYTTTWPEALTSSYHAYLKYLNLY